uniref:NADH-quinone oxidoreductase subunit B n=1 Tax=Fervidicoccus fontis TaxID=683846 RepID=A0A7J3ZNR4_9CREN
MESLAKPIKKIVDWATSFSLWPVHLMTACCGCELAVTYAPRLDTERLGSLPFTHARNTNTVIIEGAVTKKMARALKVTYEQMPHPKFVIGMGACAIDGGLFYNSYNLVKPWKVVPINNYIPGCPPRPEALTQAVYALQKEIREKELASYKFLGFLSRRGKKEKESS